jgi:hypothetical protein
MSFRLTYSEPTTGTAFNKKAVALMSGGLDSVLAIHLVKQQGIDVTAIHFTSFFSIDDPEAKDSPVRVTAEQLGVPVKFFQRGDDFLQLLRNPRYGYGKNLNPCIDCRIYTLVKAREYMESIGASFLVTGEVVGQRPMSQRRHTLRLIEKQARCKGIVLRPLSAKVLPPTGPEDAGILSRDMLLGVAGRGRKVQLDLAADLNLWGFSSPAGGCLLTDRNFSRRLKDLLTSSEDVSREELAALRIGRHFRIRPGLKIVVGRSEEENDQLQALAKGKNFIMPLVFPGPAVLVLGDPAEEEKELVCRIIRRYAKPMRRGDMFTVQGPQSETEIIQVSGLPSEEWLSEHLI